MAELRKRLDFTRKISAPDVVFDENGLSLSAKAAEWDLKVAENAALINDRTLYSSFILDEVATYEDGHYVLVDGEYVSAVGQTSGETYSLDTSTIKDKIASITTDSSNLEVRVKANEDAITVINGDAATEGSIANAISKVVDSAPEAFDTLKEISDWISADETGTAALVQRVTDAETEIDELQTNLGWDAEAKDAVRVTNIEDSIEALVSDDKDMSIREIAEDAIAEYHVDSDAALKEWVKSEEGARTAVYGNVLTASYPDGLGTRTTGLIENRTVVYTTKEVVDNVETDVEHTVELGAEPFTPTANGYILNAKDGSTHEITQETPVKIYATDVNIATAISSLEHAVEVASENHELEAAGLEGRIAEIEDTIGGTSGTSLVDRITALEEQNAQDDEDDSAVLDLIDERTQYEEVNDEGVNLTVKDKIAELEENTSITSDELADLIGSLENFLVETISYWKDDNGVASEFVAGTTYTAVTDVTGTTNYIADVESYVEGDNKSGINIDLDLDSSLTKTVNFESGAFKSAVYTFPKGTVTVDETGYVTFVPNTDGAGEVYEALVTVPEDASSRLDRVEAQASKNASDIENINEEIENIKVDLTKVGTKFVAGTVTETNDSISINGTSYTIYEYFGADWDFTDISVTLPEGNGIFMVLDSYAIVSEINVNDDTKTVLNKVCNVLMSEDGGKELLVNNQIYDYDEMYSTARLVNAKFLVRKTV